MEIVEGRRAVLELLRGGRAISKIYLAKGSKPSEALREIVQLAGGAGIPVSWVGRKIIDEETGGGAHQGVAAYVEPFKFADLSDVIRKIEGRKSAILLALDGITDPHNVGALIRSADAAGVDGVILPKRRSVSVTATVYKTSAGAVEHVPIVQVGNLVSAIERLKDAGFWAYGADSSAKQDLFAVDFAEKVLLVLGSEGAGLSRLIKEKCDELVSIKMRGKISSLNVSVAGALMMYEILRKALRR